jgi:phospholipid/cholesterol/gamma-HCH transport system substrate-binding protein
MNNKVNYTLVGIVVLIAITLMLGFSYWLLKPSSQYETQRYMIYFNESVLGLNIDAPVKYRGIDVGKVTRLRINPKNSEQVEVLVTILESTPIKTDTVARLTSQGITGLSYINLSLGSDSSPVLKAAEDEEYPVIATAPSFFERFEKSLGSVSTQLSDTLSKTEELLSKENQDHVLLLVKRSANVMQRLESALNEQSIAHFQATLANVEKLTHKLNTTMPKVDYFIDKSIAWEHNVSGSMASIMKSYLGVRSSMAEIKRAVSSGEFNVKEISKDVVPTMNDTLLQMQELMIRLEGTLEQYERSPGDILFKQEEMRKGPGE